MIFGWKTKPEWIAVYDRRAAERVARMEKLMKFKQMQYAISRQMYDPEMLAQRINPAPVEMDGRPGEWIGIDKIAGGLR